MKTSTYSNVLFVKKKKKKKIAVQTWAIDPLNQMLAFMCPKLTVMESEEIIFHFLKRYELNILFLKKFC